MTQDLLPRLQAALQDRYRIERPLGAGGMATVYLAEDLKHHRPVAVKVLKPELAASLGADRFLREITITANLNHPHILPLLDSGEADVFLFYVMPYVEGESLRDRLNREKQLPIDESFKIASEVANALGFAHEHNVIHRDIKPENVLLSAGEAVVADFGIARAITEAGGEHLTETGISIGSPAYMSPEQASGERKLDGRSDIYSLGCVLYEMLTGDPPFAASTAQALLARKSLEQAPAVSTVRETVPENVERAIAKALARFPSDRHATALEFAAAVSSTAESIPAEVGQSTIAVLPFANMSADPENEYFSDGVTEEIINAIAGIPDVRVTARTSAFQFKGKEYDVREIGRKLNVGTVLEGSVRKAGNKVRVTAQLINVADGYHLWSQRFDRDLEDVFAIQDEISVAIADRLKSEFTLMSRQATTSQTAMAPPDPAAYDAYLRGRYHRRNMFGGANALLMASASYHEAIERDPSFAAAYSALAELHTVLSIGFAIQPSRELMPKAKEYAGKALSLNPDLAEAQLARALVAMYYEWDYAAAKAGIDRALAISPNLVGAHFWAEFYYTYVERDFEQAVAANRRAIELDPLDLNVTSRLAQVYLLFDRVDEAVGMLEKILETEPNHMVSHLELADGLMRTGDVERGIAEAERAMELSGRAAACVAIAGAMYAISGNTEKARELIRELEDRSEQGHMFRFQLAVVHWALGEMDRAFEYLAEAQRDRDPNLLYISALPHVVWRKPDPRYDAVLREMGLGHLVNETSRSASR